jgi:1-deoxy-D-xylulose-5-phosphate synthase
MLQTDITKYVFPDDLRSMTDDELELLAVEIRDFLITNISETGGHLAPNLGVVELSIALHATFDFPRDSVVWDVGHQAYVHKILTGRASEFPGLRRRGGISGFPRPSESPYDIYAGGHSSTSISYAMGLAEARDLRGEDGYVVAVIGDGSMTGGPAFEGLNNAGTKRTRMIVVLNDNNMSIAHNIGSLSRHLNMLRSSTAYLEMKKSIKRRLAATDGFGDRILHGIERMRDSLRYALTTESIFEDMGFSYFGPIDGHNIEELRDILSGVKAIDGPVLVHAITKKGKGYKNAEAHPERFHGVGPFDSVTGLPAVVSDDLKWSTECGEELKRLASHDERVVAVTAAMAGGTGLSDYAATFPKRFYDTGIAEMHAVTFASGLAMKGLRPFVAVYSTFLQRAYDQLIEDAALHRLPVTFLIDRAGSVGEDGETHHGVFDLSYLGHIPGMRVLAPSDATTLRGMMEYARRNDAGPIAIRYPKGAVREDLSAAIAVEAPPAPPTVAERNARTAAVADDLKHGRARLLREGGDVTMLCVGCMSEIALAAADLLAQRGIAACVVDALFVKPVDEAAVNEAISRGVPIVTIEDNVIAGGYGETVNALIVRKNEPLKYMPRVLNIGWPDTFVTHGSRSALMAEHGLDAAGIAARVAALVKGDPLAK